MPAKTFIKFDMQAMRDFLISHEGLKLRPYRCTAGKLTIGFGHNLEAHGVPFGISLAEITEKGITREQAISLLESDIMDSVDQFRAKFPWFDNLDTVRQMVLVDMTFNMGLGGVSDFVGTLRDVQAGRYTEASVEMLDSKWATQVGERAQQLSKMMATGQMDDTDHKPVKPNDQAWPWPHFSRKEMACQCGCGQALMDAVFMDKLEQLRSEYDAPLHVSSAYRCPKHNSAVSHTGAKGPHTTGKAVDIQIAGAALHRLHGLAFKHDFTRMGLSQTGVASSRFIHLDILTSAEGFPAPTEWTY